MYVCCSAPVFEDAQDFERLFWLMDISHLPALLRSPSTGAKSSVSRGQLLKLAGGSARKARMRFRKPGSVTCFNCTNTLARCRSVSPSVLGAAVVPTRTMFKVSRAGNRYTFGKTDFIVL